MNFLVTALIGFNTFVIAKVYQRYCRAMDDATYV